MIDDPPEPSTSNSFFWGIRHMQTIEQMADVPMRDDTDSASTKEANKNDVTQMERTGDGIAYPGKRYLQHWARSWQQRVRESGCRRQQV